jgi:hypothetical protein
VETVHVSAHAVGRSIGKHGKTIGNIKQSSGCSDIRRSRQERIHKDQAVKESQVAIIVAGLPVNIAEAKRQIKSVCERADSANEDGVDRAERAYQGGTTKDGLSVTKCEEKTRTLTPAQRKEVDAFRRAVASTVKIEPDVFAGSIAFAKLEKLLRRHGNYIITHGKTRKMLDMNVPCDLAVAALEALRLHCGDLMMPAPTRLLRKQLPRRLFPVSTCPHSVPR